MEIERIQRELRFLRIVTLILFLALVGTWLIGASPKQNSQFDTIEVKSIKIIDDKSVARLVFAAELPNPKVQGKEYPRSTKVAGIQFNDSLGNEIGGLAIFDRLDGAGLCFDYGTAEAVCLTKIEKFGYTGLVMLDQPKPESQVGQTGSQRVLIAIENGESKLVLNDKDGKERIRLVVDTSNVARAEFLDQNGKIVYQIPQ